MASEDVVAIEQVLYRYCFAVDKGTPDDVAALFHEDAVLMAIYAGDPPVKGRAAIKQWYTNYNKNLRANVEHLRHTVTNPVVDLSGNEASAQCYLTADSISKQTGKPSWVAGYYRDKLVKEGGKWYFKERQIHVHYATEGHLQEPPK